MSDGPASRPGWTHPPWAVWLACGLAIAAAALLVAAAARPSRRRHAAATAGAIIALEAGWFLLTRTLATS